jgi:proteasome-associated ATPase
MPETTPLEILDRLDSFAPKDDARLQNYLSELRRALESDSLQKEEGQRLLAEYEQAYQKLTQPANRIGVFLDWLKTEQPDQLALITVGDSEFVSQVDPQLAPENLSTGTRVRVNDSYAVVGTLGHGEIGALATVSEVLDEKRLRLGGTTPTTAEGGRLVLRAANLSKTAVKTGDEVRLDATGRFAIEHFGKRESRDYFFEEVPAIRWDQVGGQEEAIKLIRDTIELPLIHPELFKQYEKKPIKGILLYGPPGCGKTLLGKATAHNLTQEYSKRIGKEVKEYFMYISGPKILNMWLGETERMVREIFATAREKAKEGNMVFIFMDEAESVLRTRSGGRYLNISNTVVPQFCAELDGLVSLENVVLMLTSNRPDYIDPAILRPERIDRKIKIKRPDRKAAEQILGIYLHAGLPLDADVLGKFDGEVDCARKSLVGGALEFLWQTTRDSSFLKVNLRNGSNETLCWKDLISGALLKSVVDRAKDSAIRRALEAPDKPHGITLEDLTAAITTEFKENEIFPKSDTQDDWLKLLDYEPENVASVKPIGRSKGEEFVRRTIQ